MKYETVLLCWRMGDDDLSDVNTKGRSVLMNGDNCLCLSSTRNIQFSIPSKFLVIDKNDKKGMHFLPSIKSSGLTHSLS